MSHLNKCKRFLNCLTCLVTKPKVETTSSVFAFLCIVKLKSMRISGSIEVFKILRTDSLQLLYTCLAADIFKPRDLLVSVGGLYYH